MIEAIAKGVGGNADLHQPQLVALIRLAPSTHQTAFAITQDLDFGANEFDAGFVFFQDNVIMRRLAIDGKVA